MSLKALFGVSKIERISFLDKACAYKLIFHNTSDKNFNLEDRDLEDEHKLFTEKLVWLHYDVEYSVAILSLNPENDSKIAPIPWIDFKTPDCWSLYHTPESCGPVQIKNLTVEETLVEGKFYNIRVSWQEPEHFPDFYNLHIFDPSFGGVMKSFRIEKVSGF